jgi:N-acetylneuraminate lyase
MAEANDGKGSLICHCGAIGTDLSIGLAKHAASLGVDAVASVPPFDHHFSNDEILGYFRDLVPFRALDGAFRNIGNDIPD